MANATYDNSLVDGGNGSSLTVGSNSNRILWAVIGNSADNVTPVTAISYNSVAMTLVGTAVYGNVGKVYSYILFAPTTGSNTFTVTGGSAFNLSAYSYYNTYQTLLNHQETIGSGNSVTGTVVPTASNSVIVASAWQNMVAGTFSAGTNMGNNQHPATHAGSVAADVNGDSGAISVSTAQTASGGTSTTGNASMAQIALAPDTYAPPSNGNFLAFM